MAMKFIAFFIWIFIVSVKLLNESVSAVTVVHTVGSNTIIRAPNILIKNGVIKCGKIYCPKKSFSCSVQGLSVNQNANVKTTMICKAKNGSVLAHKVAKIPNLVPGLSIKSYSSANIKGKVLSCQSCSTAAEAKKQTKDAIKLAMKGMIDKLRTIHVRTHDLAQRMTDNTVDQLAKHGTLPVSMNEIQAPEIVAQHNLPKQIAPPADIMSASAPSQVRPLASESAPSQVRPLVSASLPIPSQKSKKIAPPISSASPDMTSLSKSLPLPQTTNQSIAVPAMNPPNQSNQSPVPSNQSAIDAGIQPANPPNLSTQLPNPATNQTNTTAASSPISLTMSRSVDPISTSPIQINQQNTTSVQQQPSPVPITILSAKNSTISEQNTPTVQANNASATQGSPVAASIPTNIVPISNATSNVPPTNPTNSPAFASLTKGDASLLTNNATNPTAPPSLTQGSQSMTSPQISTKSTVIDSMLASLNISIPSVKASEKKLKGSIKQLPGSVETQPGSAQSAANISQPAQPVQQGSGNVSQPLGIASSQESLAKQSQSSEKVLQRSLKPSIGSVKTSNDSKKMAQDSGQSSSASSSGSSSSSTASKALIRAVKPSLGSLASNGSSSTGSGSSSTSSGSSSTS